jgi:hypothetical protein
MTFVDQIFQVIKEAMPANAEIREIPGAESLNVAVSWKLNDDPERPNKMSKTIMICVSHEAAEDFASVAHANQKTAYERISSFLTQRLANFVPMHNASKYETPPVEKWVIDSQVVTG